VARSVVSLLDAAAYLQGIPEDDPDLLALQAMGCFRSGAFEPGAEGAPIGIPRQMTAQESRPRRANADFH
jgi:hypothetical protein